MIELETFKFSSKSSVFGNISGGGHTKFTHGSMATLNFNPPITKVTGLHLPNNYNRRLWASVQDDASFQIQIFNGSDVIRTVTWNSVRSSSYQRAYTMTYLPMLVTFDGSTSRPPSCVGILFRRIGKVGRGHRETLTSPTRPPPRHEHCATFH